MNKESLNKYQEELSSKTNELIAYLSNEIGKISVSQQNDVVISSTPSPVSTFYRCGFGIGALLLAVGLATKTHIATVGGGIVTVVSLYGTIKKQGKSSSKTTENIDFANLTLEVYKKLEEIHSYISKKWDEYLGELKDKLKKEILFSNLHDTVKNNMIELVLNRSIIMFSMSNALTELSTIEKARDVKKYKEYCLEGFKKKYETAIKQAYKEQSERYQNIADILCDSLK